MPEQHQQQAASKYNRKAVCPKCGHADVMLRYCNVDHEHATASSAHDARSKQLGALDRYDLLNPESPKMKELARVEAAFLEKFPDGPRNVEHWDRRCRTCEYRWTEPMPASGADGTSAGVVSASRVLGVEGT